MKRFGSAAWNGGLREGKGSVSTESHALETYPYTFFSRYGERPPVPIRRSAWAGSRRLFHHVVRQTARHGELRAGASRPPFSLR
jgi:hypothetical protein